MANLESQTKEMSEHNPPHNDHDDIDDDDDQLNLSHKIVPTNHRSTSKDTNKQDIQLPNESLATATSSDPLTSVKYDVEKLIKNDVKKYLNISFPKDQLGFVECRIKRQKGRAPGFPATFDLYLQGQNENDLTFLLTARKHLTIGGHSEHFIGTDENLSKNLNDENSIAKLRGINISGSEYILYDHQNSSTHQHTKQQLAAIVYDEHIFGSKEPRKFIVLLRDPEKTAEPTKGDEALIDQWRSGRLTDVIEIKNKEPKYNKETKTYTVGLYGDRVKQPSHKNFQLITSNGDHEENAIMQFGRIDENDFVLDYRYPLTAIQAFGIALSCFHNRFRT